MKSPVSIKLETETIAALDALAEREGSSRQAVIDRGIALALDGATSGTKVLRLSESQIACLDQLAGRRGVDRLELMRRYISERLSREFIDDRNRLTQAAAIRPKDGVTFGAKGR